MKVNLFKIQEEFKKISDALISIEPSFKDVIKSETFDIGKNKSNGSFSFDNNLILQKSLPLIIFEAILFYQIKSNESLREVWQEILEKSFVKEIENFKKDIGNNRLKIAIYFQTNLEKYQKLIKLPKNQISTRSIQFNSKSTAHQPALGKTKLKNTNNIIIKFRGIPPEKTHIRIGITFEKKHMFSIFILQDVVNRKDFN